MAPEIILASHPDLKCNDLHISKGNALKIDPIRFGAFSMDVKHDKKEESMQSFADAMSCKIFIGANKRKKEKTQEEDLYIQVGSVLLKCKASKYHRHMFPEFPRTSDASFYPPPRVQVLLHEASKYRLTGPE